MRLRVTPAIGRLLEEAASLSQDLRAAAAAAASDGSVEWDTLKAAVQHVKDSKGPQAVPNMQELCHGSGIAFPAPRKPTGKPPELQKRLDELRARLEQQQYDRMVHDVTQAERKAAAAREGGLVTYKQQISFGIHVLAMMAAFFAFGHVAGMALTNNRSAHPFVGLLFMVGALVLETVLFVIRSTVPPKLHLAAARRATAARIAKQQEEQQREMQAPTTAGSLQEGSSSSSGQRARPTKRKSAAAKKAD